MIVPCLILPSLSSLAPIFILPMSSGIIYYINWFISFKHYALTCSYGKDEPLTLSFFPPPPPHLFNIVILLFFWVSYIYRYNIMTIKYFLWQNKIFYYVFFSGIAFSYSLLFESISSPHPFLYSFLSTFLHFFLYPQLFLHVLL